MTHRPIEPRLKAPWTRDQTVALWRYQFRGDLHAFTCANRSSPDHPTEPPEGECELIPTIRGWVCRWCDYTQDWVWAWMADEDQHPPRPDGWRMTDWTRPIDPPIAPV